MGKKSKNKTKRGGKRRKCCESRTATPANSGTPYADESGLVSAPSCCLHGSPTGWRNIPHMSTFINNVHCKRSFDIAMKIVAEILQDGSEDEPMDGIHMLHKGLALKDDPEGEYLEAIQTLLMGLAAFGTDALLSMTRGGNAYKIFTSASQAAHTMVFLESMLCCTTEEGWALSAQIASPVLV
jgi:hypothetical protein